MGARLTRDATCSATRNGFDASGCHERAARDRCAVAEARVDLRCGGCNTDTDCCASFVCAAAFGRRG